MRSLPQKLLTVLASPGEVFDEVIATRPRLANCLAPMGLVCLATMFCSALNGGPGQAVPGSGELGDALQTSAAQGIVTEARLRSATLAVICFSTFAGTCWSAFVLWLIGRICLKTRFSFLKTVEIVALTEMILVLGTVVTGLLIAASADPALRPAASVLAGKFPIESPLRAALDTLNVFHLWSATVLAIGLSRLGAVSFRESAFWVFGYWVLVRLGFILLA
jgi:Yip1 domain